MTLIEYSLISDLLTREEWAGHEEAAAKARCRDFVARWRFDWDAPKPWTREEIEAYVSKEKRREDLAFLRECSVRNFSRKEYGVLPGGMVPRKYIKKKAMSQEDLDAVFERDLGW